MRDDVKFTDGEPLTASDVAFTYNNCRDNSSVNDFSMLKEAVAVKEFNKEETLRHPYTRALWRAMPKHGFQYIDGVQPYVKDNLQGCPFAPRCDMASQECQGEIPWKSSGRGYVRCIL